MVDCVSSSSTIRGVKKEEEQIVVTKKKKEDEEVEENPVKNCSKDHDLDDDDDDDDDEYADWRKGNWCWLLPAPTHSAAVKSEGSSVSTTSSISSISGKRAGAPKRRRDSHEEQQHDKNNNVSSEKDLLSDNDDDDDELPKKKKRKLKCYRSQQQRYNSSSIHSNNLPSSSNNSIQDNETVVDENKNENENGNGNVVDTTIIKQEEGVKTKEEEEDNSDSKINSAVTDAAGNDDNNDNDNNDADADDDDDGYESWTVGNWCLLLPSTTTSSADDEKKDDDEPPSEEVSVIENTTTQKRVRSSSHRRCSNNASSVSSSGVGDDTDENEYHDDEDCVDNDDDIIDEQTKTTGKSTIKYTKAHNEIWYGMFRRLVAYQKKHGSTNVPKRYKEDPKLGNWVSAQRTLYSRKEISEERINRLDSIGFVWKMRVQQIPWDGMFQKLVSYKKQHKSTIVPVVYARDPKLGNWVHNQRFYYKNKTLYIDHINHLESIGFVWDPLDAQWMEMYQKLVEYRTQHKFTNVPRSYKADRKLGNWVCHQRAFYKNKILSIDRINRLESIGFVWDILDAQWMEMYSKLVAYKNMHNITLLPPRYKADLQLAKWTYKQRNRKNKLTDKRMELLNSINFFGQ
jgi:hypothetical protein